MRPDAGSWLRQAVDDLRFARASLKDEFFAWTCFIAQQTAEKALKAFVIEHRATVAKTHRLLELASQCEAIDPAFESLRPQLDVLNQYYGPTRYADLHGARAPYEHYTRELAAEAISFADTILHFVQARLKQPK